MTVAVDTKRQKFTQVQVCKNCVQGYLSPWRLCARAGIACLCWILNWQVATSPLQQWEALCSFAFLPRNTAVGPDPSRDSISAVAR